MAGRGRGRFGYGRGGGRQGLDGDVDIKPKGPPPLFPERTDLPKKAALSFYVQRLLNAKRRLDGANKNSAFYLEDKKPDATKKAGYVEHVQEGQSSMREAKRPALTSVMTLDPSYFPEELYSKRDKQAAAAASTEEAQAAFWDMAAGGEAPSVDTFEEYMENLQKAAPEEGKEGEEGEEGEEGDEDEAGRKKRKAEEEANDDEDQEYDDEDEDEGLYGYADEMGGGIDDDEEYVDDEGDGGDGPGSYY